MKKTILLTGDWHCGSVFGLTPPRWQGGKYRKLQKDLFEFFELVCDKTYDVAIVNGDLIDGGIDLQYHITLDRTEQVEMAKECLGLIKANKIYITLGTPLHTNGEAEFERLLGHDARAELRIDIEGFRLHVKHKISTSKTGYGQESLLAREALGQAMYDMHVLGLPQPDLVIRSHAHRFVQTINEAVPGIIIPCLVYPFSLYGATISKWLYSMGVCELVVEGKERRYSVEPRLIKLTLPKEAIYERV